MRLNINNKEYMLRVDLVHINFRSIINMTFIRNIRVLYKKETSQGNDNKSYVNAI
jgi:hypothetical protein